MFFVHIFKLHPLEAFNQKSTEHTLKVLATIFSLQVAERNAALEPAKRELLESFQRFLSAVWCWLVL